MNESDAANNPEMEMLRNLLIGDERRELDDIKRSLDETRVASDATQQQIAELAATAAKLQAEAADEKAFLAASAQALPEALAQAGQSNPTAIARALSPFVVSSIRREIVNSRDEMVDALYPITGRLVAASVRNSIAQLSEEINERMNALTSMAMWNARVQAWRTGEPVSKFVLASGRDFHVLRAMLLDRGSGIPLSVSEADDVPERSDTNLISGLLTALSNLTEEVYTSAADELRRVDLNGRQIAFRRSASQLLVIEFVGQPAADVLSDIDRRFGDIVALVDREDRQPLDDAVEALLHLEAPYEIEEAANKSRYALWAMVGLLVVLVGWMLGAAFGRWQLDNTVERLEAVIDRNPQLAAYPISVEADYDNNAVSVRGLLPRTVSTSDFQKALESEAESTPVSVFLQSVADQQAMARAETLVAELGDDNAVIRQSLESMQNHIGDVQFDDLRDSLRQLSDRIAKVSTVFTGAVEQLGRAVTDVAVAFEADLVLADPAATDADLKRLAALVLKTPEDLIIVPNWNAALGESSRWPKARALYVRTQLLRLGVPVAQLHVAEPRVVNTEARSRTVEFELRARAETQ